MIYQNETAYGPSVLASNEVENCSLGIHALLIDTIYYQKHIQQLLFIVKQQLIVVQIFIENWGSSHCS